MPNFCYNELHVTGHPERVHEFKVFNAQHVEDYSNAGRETWAEPHKHPGYPARHLVGPRNPHDLAFRAAAPVEGEPDIGRQSAAWGTKWDTGSETFALETQLERSPVLAQHDLRLARSWSIGFDTAWEPPSRWVATASARFDQVSMVLGFSEPGNGDFGVLSGYAGAISRQAVRRCMPAARAQARRDMPRRPRVGKLLTALLHDDVAAAQKALTPGTVNTLIEARWTPLMYAAYAGAEHAFEWLLRQGADPLWSAPSGVGVRDVLLDLYPSQPAALVEARYRMFRQALSVRAEVVTTPLGTGVTVREMVVRFAMAPIMPELFSPSTQEAPGALGGWMNLVEEYANASALPLLLPAIPNDRQRVLFDALAERAGKRGEVELLRVLTNLNAQFSDAVLALLSGKTPGAAPDAVAYYLAYLARKALAEGAACARPAPP